MSRYRFTVEFDCVDDDPRKWFWPDLIDIDDPYTQTDWSTWNVEEIND